MDLATMEGLEGVSLQRLADELGMSKSGVIGHFASKEDLQLRTVEAAAERYREEVMERAADREAGLERLRALLEGWIAQVEARTPVGGCFFWAASAEFDGRPGPVRELLVALMERFVGLLEAEVHTAQRTGELRADVEPAQLAFELHAVAQEANWARQLLGREDAFERARAAVARLLEASRPA